MSGVETKERQRAINRLEAGASYCGCGRYLRYIDEIGRQEIYAHYEFERLERKYNDILKIYYTEAGENWNQTLYIYLFSYIGDPANKKIYKHLAKMVSYNSILRERSNPMRVEALLLGASGLLKDYGDDLYTLTIKREAEYLMRKYNITPLSSRDWNLYRVKPINHPVLRLAQIATLFVHNELLLDKVLACRCIEDIEEIFSVVASDYWSTHYIPSKVSDVEVKRLGREKCNILGINVVVMIQYAYGSYTSSDKLIDQAQNLIQDLKPEYNMIVNRWRNYGITPKTAFESQALIQIANEHCAPRKCRECYLGARAIEDFSWLDQEE
ncbi:MAG: DUF2851 family protein [Rikenellaceae bacterium]